MPELPSGTVTFLFTDIEGSTRLLQQLGSLYADVLAEERSLLRTTFHERDGHEIDTAGDGLFVAFGRATQAVSAAAAAQRSISTHPWPEGLQVRVRMGLHTGEAVLSAGGYVGLDVHRAARICSAGHGGQTLLSQTTRDLVEHDLPTGVSLRALGSHRLKDLEHPEVVFQLIIPDLPTDFPPLKSLDRLPNNLPIQLTSFIGREREMAEIKRMLSAARLLTLTGSGGCGKTRLALQVAADLVGEFPDGAWLVELAALSDPNLVPQAVASVLGVREEPGHLPMGEVGPGGLPGTSVSRSILTRLLDYLQARRMLIMLDNCEHLIGACATFSDTLLRACPNLKVLATSREGLGIAGETAWRVPSLSLPDVERLRSVEASTLTQYEAVRLFIDRAVAALPTFAVTNHNAPAMAQICHRLDGIPFAIELAAARVKALSVEQIAKRLDDRFRLLTGGSRTALPRQQTLRATIDWSYDLLSESERILFRRLSVFAGGWTLPAAEAICGDVVEANMLPRPDDVLDLLTHLVDKSLVVMEEQEGEGRYRFLETIRQYARDKLLESGEGAALRDCHLKWFLDLAEQGEPELHGPDQAAWLDKLEAEHDNLRTALEWSLGSGEVEAGIRLAGALWFFWFLHGYYSEGFKWLEGALSRSSGASVSVRTKALNRVGHLAYCQGDYEQAVTLNEESRAMYQELGDKKGIARSLSNLGLVASSQGDYERMTALFEESLALSLEVGDKVCTTLSLRFLGNAAYNRGDYERAAALGDESLVLFRELGAKGFIAGGLERLARVAVAQGQPERATRLFGAAEALRQALGYPLPPSDRHEYDRSVAAARAGLGEEAFAKAWAEGRKMTMEEAIQLAIGGGQ